jgi:hypothetical protein
MNHSFAVNFSRTSRLCPSAFERAAFWLAIGTFGGGMSGGVQSIVTFGWTGLVDHVFSPCVF